MMKRRQTFGGISGVVREHSGIKWVPAIAFLLLVPPCDGGELAADAGLPPDFPPISEATRQSEVTGVVQALVKAVAGKKWTAAKALCSESLIHAVDNSGDSAVFFEKALGPIIQADIEPGLDIRVISPQEGLNDEAMGFVMLRRMTKSEGGKVLWWHFTVRWEGGVWRFVALEHR